MKQTLEGKISIIRESFKASRAAFMETSGSFRVDFDAGHTVYIYAETYDNSITARLEATEPDPDKRRVEIEKLRDMLVTEISFADIGEFQETQSFKNRYVYTAGVDIDESVFFHETIVIGDNKAKSDEVFSVQEAEQESLPDLFEIEPENSVARSPVEEAIKKLETVDAKMLRQGLDMMNLKRSSNVRMALTRIFRSAGDTEELMLSIQSEAQKIISLTDQDDLQMVKSIYTDGFLEPVIWLLYEEVFGKSAGS